MTTTIDSRQSAPSPRSESGMHLDQAAIDRWLHDGYMVCGVISREELDALEAEVLAMARGRYDMAEYTPPPATVGSREALERILCIHQPTRCP